jgi:hypothetical protein
MRWPENPAAEAVADHHEPPFEIQGQHHAEVGNDQWIATHISLDPENKSV